MSLSTLTPFGCVGSDSVNIVTFPQPVIDLGPDTSLCDGVVFDSGSSGFVSCTWSDGTGGPIVQPAGSGTYWLDCIDMNGCLASDTIEITLDPNPVITLPDTLTDCEEVAINAGNPGATYSWSTSETTQSIDVSSSGDYSVTVTSPEGCSSIASVYADVQLPPSVSFTADFLAPDSVSFIMNLSGSAPFDIIWNFGDGDTSSSVMPTHVYDSDGSYLVTVTVINDCGVNSASQTIDINTVGIEDDLFSRLFSVFPNPNNGNFRVEGNGLSGSGVELEMLDAGGRSVYQFQQSFTGESFVHDIEATKLSRGIYLLKISDGEHLGFRKVLIE